jgi:hypothetical protein
MRRKEVMWVLGELVLSQKPAELIDRGRADDQQKKAAHDLENSVEALEGDADCEGSVEEVAAPEPIHLQLRSLTDGHT